MQSKFTSSSATSSGYQSVLGTNFDQQYPAFNQPDTQGDDIEDYNSLLQELENLNISSIMPEGMDSMEAYLDQGLEEDGRDKVEKLGGVGVAVGEGKKRAEKGEKVDKNNFGLFQKYSEIEIKQLFIGDLVNSKIQENGIETTHTIIDTFEKFTNIPKSDRSFVLIFLGQLLQHLHISIQKFVEKIRKYKVKTQVESERQKLIELGKKISLYFTAEKREILTKLIIVYLKRDYVHKEAKQIIVRNFRKMLALHKQQYPCSFKLTSSGNTFKTIPDNKSDKADKSYHPGCKTNESNGENRMVTRTQMSKKSSMVGQDEAEDAWETKTDIEILKNEMKNYDNRRRKQRQIDDALDEFNTYQDQQQCIRKQPVKADKLKMTTNLFSIKHIPSEDKKAHALPQKDEKMSYPSLQSYVNPEQRPAVKKAQAQKTEAFVQKNNQNTSYNTSFTLSLTENTVNPSFSSIRPPQKNLQQVQRVADDSDSDSQSDSQQDDVLNRTMALLDETIDMKRRQKKVLNGENTKEKSSTFTFMPKIQQQKSVASSRHNTQLKVTTTKPIEVSRPPVADRTPSNAASPFFIIGDSLKALLNADKIASLNTIMTEYKNTSGVHKSTFHVAKRREILLFVREIISIVQRAEVKIEQNMKKLNAVESAGKKVWEALHQQRIIQLLEIINKQWSSSYFKVQRRGKIFDICRALIDIYKAAC